MTVTGWMTLDTVEGVRLALRHWAKLVSRPDEFEAPIVERLFESLQYQDGPEGLYWMARAILIARSETSPPFGEVETDWDTVSLSWEGTWTPGRFVVLDVWWNGNEPCCRLSWDTGTDRPSRFLGWIETLLALASDRN